MFQSTPPAEARGDTSASAPSGAASSFQSTPPAKPSSKLPFCFNPLPPPKRGETSYFPSQFNTPLWFQSTPPAEARGDETTHGPKGNPVKTFQSTPPAEARGDACTAALFLTYHPWFQSTPPAEARGDRRRAS